MSEDKVTKTIIKKMKADEAKKALSSLIDKVENLAMAKQQKKDEIADINEQIAEQQGIVDAVVNADNVDGSAQERLGDIVGALKRIDELKDEKKEKNKEYREQIADAEKGCKLVVEDVRQGSFDFSSP